MKTKLRFFKQDGRWYADVPEHSLDDNEMVLGADEFLEKAARGSEKILIELSTEEENPYLVKLAMVSHDDEGAEYIISGPIIDSMEENGVVFPFTVWICNVTHTVLGEHPETMYITRLYRE